MKKKFYLKTFKEYEILESPGYTASIFQNPVSIQKILVVDLRFHLNRNVLFKYSRLPYLNIIVHIC